MTYFGARRFALHQAARKTTDQLVAAIFASASGAWLDASDAATRFQEGTGLTPTTAAGQATGLVLDKSRGLALGSELVGGTFDSSSAGWVGAGVSLSIVNGWLRATLTATPGYVGFPIPTVIGRCYKVGGKWRSNGAGTCGLRVGTSNGSAQLFQSPVSTAGSATGHFIASTTTSWINVRSINGFVVGDYFEIDEISVREFFGNPASQVTSTARPLYQTGPDRFVLDGIDDVLVVQLPAAGLGNNCTVVTSVPGVGAQLLTDQVIGASHSITSSFCARLLIDRPLSAAETLAVTRWANQKAGL